MTSIIILSYNTKELIELCLISIRKYTKATDYEIIVIDNGSADGSREYLVAQPDVRLIVNKENVGFPKGCNQGLAAAKGDDLLLLNSDVVTTPHWLDNLQTALHAHPGIGAVGPVTNHTSFLQQIAVTYDKNLDLMLSWAADFNKSNPDKWCVAPKLVGFCLLLKREVYEQLGGLDEIFSPGNYEDDDYSLRMRLAGYKLLICRDTFVHHFGSSSFKNAGEGAARRYNALLKNNKARFLDKWRLSEGYGAYHPQLLDFPLPPQAKILILAREFGLDPYLFRERYPAAQISLILNCEGDAAALAPDFATATVPDIGEAPAVFSPGGYDAIICAWDVNAYETGDKDNLIKAATLALRPGGILLYGEDNALRIIRRIAEDGS